MRKPFLISAAIFLVFLASFYSGSVYHAVFGASASVQSGATTAPALFAVDRGPAWSYVVDLGALIVGTLAIVFAIVALTLPIAGIVKFSDLMSQAESQLKSKIDPQVDKAVSNVNKNVDQVTAKAETACTQIEKQVQHIKSEASNMLETEIRPKAQKIIEDELTSTIDKGKTRIETEIGQLLRSYIDDIDLTQALVEKVAAELRNRPVQTVADVEAVSPKEFN